LGSQWLDIEPLMGWLALATGLMGLSAGAYTAFDAIGKPRLGARMQWTRLVFLLIVLVPVSLILRNVVAIAIARLVVTALFIPTLLFAVGHELSVSAMDYARVTWRPAAASMMMSSLVYLANGWISPGNLRFAVDVLLGVFSFTFFLLCLWRVSGKPDGPERDVWGILINTYGKIRQAGAAG
jgi:O-antigen/teichoic acid export membrane protein